MPTFTAPLNVLQRALAALTPHLEVDGWTPVLETVNVVNDDSDVLLLATDRFTAVEYRLPHVEVADPEFIREHETLLLMDDAIRHIRDFNLLPPSEWDDGEQPPNFAPEGWSVTVDLVDAAADDLTTGALVVTIVDDKGVEQSRRRLDALRRSYPDVHRLIPDELAPVSTLSCSAQILSRLAATARALDGAFGPAELTISSGQVEDRHPVFVIEFAPAPARMVFSQRSLPETGVEE